MATSRPSLSTALTNLLSTYHDLNPSSPPMLSHPPTPLEFLRAAYKNQPFILRGGARDWPACRRWDGPAYLRSKMGRTTIGVATTPTGRADAVELDAGGKVFVQPEVSEEGFSEVLDYIVRQERAWGVAADADEGSTAPPAHGEVKYAQMQNNSLHTQFVPLLPDVLPSIPWADEALGQRPDAVNLWLGNSLSVTSLHRDPYENVYVQVVGRKRFVLVPAVETARVREEMVGGGRWARDGEGEWVVSRDEDGGEVPVAMVELGWSQDDKTDGVRKMVVELDAGDVLYLPALWYHQVAQRCGREGYCVSVNYWYDMEYSGGFYALMGFVREVGLVAREEDREEGGHRTPG